MRTIIQYLRKLGNMKKNSSLWLFILVTLVLPSLAWLIIEAYEIRVQQLPVLGRYDINRGSKASHHISDFSLVNQDNKKITSDALSDKIVVADFFFSHCASVCPRMTANLKKLQKELKNDPEVRIYSFSVDPERDSAARLKEYATQFEIDTQNWDLLTGDKKDIYKLARNSFMIVATDGDGGPNDFIHSDKIVLVDKQRRIRGYYDGTSESETRQLSRDIKKLKHEE
jgi:protein SCO1/2